MTLSALAARYARVPPSRAHVALPIAIMAALYGFSSLPGTPTPDAPSVYGLFYWMPPSVQNIAHIPAYAVLAWAWRWAMEAWTSPSSSRTIGPGSLTMLYGVFDEWHQSFVPGRYGSWTDVALDGAGAVLGIWISVLASRYAARQAGQSFTMRPPVRNRR